MSFDSLYHNDRQSRLKFANGDEMHSHLSEFERFLQNHEREYETIEEREERFYVFRKNLVLIEEVNEMVEGDTEFGVNELSDWTDEEFKAMLLPLDYYKDLRRNATFIKKQQPLETASLEDFPESFDWREKGVVGPVKAQGNCGSCWAFATAATVECAYAIGHKKLLSLSEQELLDCNLENNACNGGNMDKAFRFVHENGLTTEDAYPYVAHRQNTCAVEGDTVKVQSAYFLNPDEQSIINWLVNFGPVNIGISVPPDMKPYKGGIYKPTDYDCKFRVVGLHALLIVGYGKTDEGEKYWIVKNSWGQKWGVENGYVYFARGVNSCGIEDEPVGVLA
jgi:C1A family cysteine protease